MKLSISLVPLIKIKPTASRWNFSESELEQAAQLLLDVEGCINPLVVCRAEGFSSYTVLDGNFEYYAAATAKEQDPKKFDKIEAFIVNTDEVESIRKQIQLLRRKPPAAGNGSRTQPPADIQARLAELEHRQDSLEQRQIQLEQGHSSLGEWGGSSARLLSLFNTSGASELLPLLQRVGLVGKSAARVVDEVEYERERRQFASLKEVVKRVKGLSSERMVDLTELF